MKSVIVAQNSCPYDVGDILTTMNTTAPSERWPGTSWTQITDCMLRAADDEHPAGSNGGAWEVTQTVEQMPKHDHNVGGAGAAAPNGIQFPAWQCAGSSSSGASGGRYYPLSIMSSGGGQPMPIVNKYIACYIWQRTA